MTVMVENEHLVMKLTKWLPAGPLFDESGHKTGERQHDLVQFIAKDGGYRTAKVENLTIL